MSDIKSPAAHPCGSCPYRIATPSGIWAAEEYDKLPAYDNDTFQQPASVFLCHQHNGRACAGWVGCHDMTHNLALRVAIMNDRIDADTVDAIIDYTTTTPLFNSGAEAAEHGKASIDRPSDAAVRAMKKITRTRAFTDKPVTGDDQ